MKKFLIILLAICAIAFAQSKQKATVVFFTDSKTGKKYKVFNADAQVWFMQDLGNYVWDDAMKSCPAGWRLPANEDWKNLEGFLATNAELREEFRRGAKIREKSSREHGINASSGYWWSATEAVEIANGAYFQFMYDGYNDMYEGYEPKRTLYAVRCVRDIDAAQ